MNHWHQTLLKLFLFAFVYGLIFCNWVDLFAGGAYITAIPAYHIWFTLMLFIPFFAVVLLFGTKDIELTIALGLLASLMNDIFYFVVGDAFFGFNVAILPWWANQFGLNGNAPCFVFQGGFFTFTVTSWMMGAAIYARIAVVALILRSYWLKHVFGRK